MLDVQSAGMHPLFMANRTIALTARTITDMQITALRREASAVGDLNQVNVCDRALRGRGGKGECARVINEASASDYDWDAI